MVLPRCSCCRGLVSARCTRPSSLLYFGGPGEPRRGIVFAIPPDILADLQTIDDWAQKHATTSVWYPCVKEHGTYAGSAKAKINVTGANSCRIVGMNGEPMEWPENWFRLPVVPVVEVRGIYTQKTGSGLILDVTYLMVGEEARGECDFL